MSVAEIAEKLELKEQTVSVLKSRVKSKLVTEIQEIRTDLEW
jgi:DNA-binding NarL/FixJ family response regulator